MKANTALTAVILCFILSSAYTSPPIASAQQSKGDPETISPCSSSEARQFDFWAGEWDVRNLVWQQEKGWVDVGRATNKVYTLLDGCAVIEHWKGEFRGNPLYGFSIRAFDPSKKKWVLVLNWTSKGSRSFGILEGGFRHGRGEFFFNYRDPEGKDVIGRYSFSDINDKSFRWDSAKSTDGGRLWHTDWIMEFTRRDARSDLPLFNGPARSNSLCPNPETRELDFIIGEWEGERQSQRADGSQHKARVSMQSLAILGGCAVMDFLDVIDGEWSHKEFRIRALDPNRKKWVEYGIDSSNPSFVRLEGEHKNGVAEFLSPVRGNGDGNLSRTRWEQGEDGSLQMESARSADGGKNWTITSRTALKRKR